MRIERIEAIAREAMENQRSYLEREPGWLYYHGRRTARLGHWLANELAARVDQDVVYAGALFHDIGLGVEPHNETGALRTRELLANDCTPQELDAVCDVVERHNQRRDPSAPLAARIVQDADLLDHVGIVGVWTTIYANGVNALRFEHHQRAHLSEQRAAALLKIRGDLNFGAAKKLFDARVAEERAFFDRFHRVYVHGDG